MLTWVPVLSILITSRRNGDTQSCHGNSALPLCSKVQDKGFGLPI